jgi:DNA-binding NarL/FixJ family response regulator
MLLEGSMQLNIAGEGGCSDDVFALVDVHKPDVLLLDVEIPGIPADQTIRRVRRTHPHTAIIVLTMHSDAHLERQLLRAGAADFVTKTVTGEALIEVVISAIASPLSRCSTDEDRGTVDILTNREHEVLRMIAQAYTNRAIGAYLRIAEGTVKRHTTNMYVKLGATSRIDAVRKAARLGLLE